MKEETKATWFFGIVIGFLLGTLLIFIVLSKSPYYHIEETKYPECNIRWKYAINDECSDNILFIDKEGIGWNGRPLILNSNCEFIEMYYSNQGACKG